MNAPTLARQNIAKAQLISTNIIKFLDEQVWDEVALKKIAKMSKPMLSLESNKMLIDFVALSIENRKIKHSSFEEETSAETVKKDNFIGCPELKDPFGRKTKRNSPRQQIKSNRRRNFTVTSASSKLIENKSNLPVLSEEKITFQSLNNKIVHQDFELNPHEITIADKLRASLKQKKQYEQNMQEEIRLKSELTTKISNKRRKQFKQVKSYTYNYEGQFVSSGKSKGEIKVPSMNAKMVGSLVEKRKGKVSLSCSNVAQKVIRDPYQKHYIEKKQSLEDNPYHKYDIPKNIIGFFGSQENLSQGVKIMEPDRNASLTSCLHHDDKNLHKIKLETFKKLYSDKKFQERSRTFQSQRIKSQSQQSQSQANKKQPFQKILTQQSQNKSFLRKSNFKRDGIISIGNSSLFNKNFSNFQNKNINSQSFELK